MRHIVAEKGRIRADLAAARSALLQTLVALTMDASQTDGREATPILAELVAGDRAATREVQELSPTGGHVAETPEPTGSVLRALVSARRALLDTFAKALSDPDRITPGLDGKLDYAMRRRAVADSEACQRLQALGCGLVDAETGLLAVEALRAARKELLTTIALIPQEARPTTVVAPGETLQRRLVQLEAEDRSTLTLLGRSGPPVPEVGGWDETWKRLHRTRQHLLRAVEARGSGIDLALDAGCLDRDRALAAQLRAARLR